MLGFSSSRRDLAGRARSRFGSQRLEPDLADPGGIARRTVRRWPLISTLSPALASRPSRSRTRPPAVSASVSGISRPQVSARTSSGHAASTSKAFSPIGVISGVSRSNSSWIGPTSSSSTFSSVTMPTTLPYSSSSMAR